MKFAAKCCTCNVDVWLPDALLECALRSPGVYFYCGYGHPQHFKEIRKQEDAAKQEPRDDNVVNFPKNT